MIESLNINGLDGELITGDFRKSTSELRRTYGEPKFQFMIFDYFVPETNWPFERRLNSLYNCLSLGYLPDWCIVLPQIITMNEGSLLCLEQGWLNEGHEGAMLKSPNGLYKFNRSTLKEGLLLKVKRYTDAEAEIIGFYEQETNNNESFINELGTSSRSSHQENKVGKDTLGGLLVRDCKTKQEFRIGTGQGWTTDWRLDVYRNQDKYLGRVITYKHLPHGNYDLPRNASMKGFRDEWDLGG
jgi:DNA ligase-1